MPLKTFFLLHIAFIVSAYSTELICAPNFEVIGLNADISKSSAEILQNKMRMQPDARQLIVPLEESYIFVTNNINNQISWAKSCNCLYLLQTTLKQLEKNIQASVRVMSLETGEWIFERDYEARKADALPIVFARIGNTLQNQEFIEAEAEAETKAAEAAEAENLYKKRNGFINNTRLGFNYYQMPGPLGTESGYGIIIGMVMTIPIRSNMAFELGLSSIMRMLTINEHNEYSTTGYEENKRGELAISIPASLKVAPFGGPLFYVESGLQLDFPFESYYSRYPIDFGFSYGFGWNFGDHSSLGFRGITGLTPFGKDFRGKPVQYELDLYGLFAFVPIVTSAAIITAPIWGPYVIFAAAILK
jgi:hypothetical protein